MKITVEEKKYIGMEQPRKMARVPIPSNVVSTGWDSAAPGNGLHLEMPLELLQEMVQAACAQGLVDKPGILQRLGLVPVKQPQEIKYAGCNSTCAALQLGGPSICLDKVQALEPVTVFPGCPADLLARKMKEHTWGPAAQEPAPSPCEGCQAEAGYGSPSCREMIRARTEPQGCPDRARLKAAKDAMLGVQ
jgi:hypothetical protein